MNAEKFHTAIWRLAKASCAPFWTSVTKEDTAVEDEKKAEDKKSEEVSAKAADKIAEPEPAKKPAFDDPAQLELLPREGAPVPKREGVAVLVVGGAGEIIAAREACAAVFGWEASALVGQNLRVLLKRGLDNEVGEFLHGLRTGSKPPTDHSLRVTAVRKDRTEFSALVTTLVWNRETKENDCTLRWTASFEDFAAKEKSAVSQPELVEARSDSSPRPAAEPKPAVAERQPEKPSSAEKEAEKPAAAEKESEKSAAPKAGSPPPRANTEHLVSAAAVLASNTAAGKAKLAEAKDLLAAVAKISARSQVRLKVPEPLDKPIEAPEKTEAKAEKDGESKPELKKEESKKESNKDDSESEDVALLREERDELKRVLTAEQIAAAELKNRLAAAEEQWRKVTRELEEVKDEAQKRTRAEFELRARLDETKEAADYASAAMKDAVSRREQLEKQLETLTKTMKDEQAQRTATLEQELTKLRTERCDLDQKLAYEEHEATEASSRAEELERHLTRNAEEFERTKLALEKQTAERQRLESTLRQQLDSALASKKGMEVEWAGAMERNKRFEEALATFRLEQEDLRKKLEAEQQAAQEAKERAKAVENRLGQNAAEVDRAKSEIEKYEAERARAEAEWREQMEIAKALTANLENSRMEAVERGNRLQQELTAAQQERDEFKEKIAVLQEAAAEAKLQAEDLHTHLQQNTAEMERLRAAAEKYRTERFQVENNWREQVENARALTKKVEADWADALERNVKFEEQFAVVQRERDQLEEQLRTATEAAQRAEELEKAKEDSEKRNKELEDSEADLRKQLDNAKALAKKLDAAWSGAVERNRRYEEEVAGLREEIEKLRMKSSKLQILSSKKMTKAQKEELVDVESLPRPSKPAKAAKIRKPRTPTPPKVNGNVAEHVIVDRPPTLDSVAVPTPNPGHIQQYDFANTEFITREPASKRRGKG